MTVASIAVRINRSMTTATNRADTAASRARSSGSPGAQLTACFRSCDRSAEETGDRSLASSVRSNNCIRGWSTRSRGTSGVARRTASGGRGGDGFVMSGSSSGMLPKSGRSVNVSRAELEPVQPAQHRQRFFRGCAPVDGRGEQATRFRSTAAMKRRDALLQQLFRLALLFRERAARPLDVGARTRVIAIEKERPRPHINGLLVAPGKIVIKTDKEEVFDLV